MTKKSKTTPTVPTRKKEQPDKFTNQQMIDALISAKGMRTKAAQKLRCDYKTVVRYINEYPEVAEAERLSRETMLDAIELKAYAQAMKGDTAMLIFMLKTQGKGRGYQEKTVNVNYDMSKLSDDELRAIVEG